MSTEIEVGGQRYRLARKLDCMTQMHVTRRLGPALVICGVSFKMMMEGARLPLDHWVGVAGPVMQVVSNMKDEDFEYVVNACLSVAERYQAIGAGVWSPVLSPKPEQRVMFDDMDQAEVLRLVVEVLRSNLANFAKGMAAGGSSTEDSAGAATP